MDGNKKNNFWQVVFKREEIIFLQLFDELFYYVMKDF